MPYSYQLTWVENARRWRKRYQGRTYYLKTRVNGKRDRAGYEVALKEWQRLKTYIDGLGPNPYTHTGVLIPDDHAIYVSPVYCPPATEQAYTYTELPSPRPTAVALQRHSKPDNPFILGTGFHPELAVIDSENPNLCERRIGKLATAWLDHRRKLAERGELSLKQWAEDKAKLHVFRNFIATNFPAALHVDEINPAMLNLYRDKQWELVETPDAEHRVSKATLRKRLSCLTRWLQWLVDENTLAELPKDLSKFCQVKLDKPKPAFWSVDEIKLLAKHATERTKLYLMLALNLGWTQKDIATLEPSMIHWETGIVTRPRHKTGVASKAKLWPSTLKLLQENRSPASTGPVLVDQKGSPLYVERINANGNLVPNDTIRLAFDRLKKNEKVGLESDPRSFKHLRKTAANEIEKANPDLTELFLAHAETKTKRFYVEQHYQELFTATDKLESHFGF